MGTLVYELAEDRDGDIQGRSGLREYLRSQEAGIGRVRGCETGWRVALRSAPSSFREFSMLRWAVVFLVIAIIAAVFGFGGIAGEAAWIAKVLALVFVVLLVVSLAMGKKPKL